MIAFTIIVCLIVGAMLVMNLANILNWLEFTTGGKP